MAVFGISIFLSAFLLFMVQPLLGKYLTPWFGGGAGVWLTCLAFFQVVLFLGYAYAHVLQRISPRTQALIHTGGLWLMVAWFCMAAWLWGSPILPDATTRPHPTADPTLQITRFLGLSIGLPFLLLSATSSLYQAWWATASRGISPFRFYALSNAGSLLALVAYPILLEPCLPLHAQAWIWGGGFLLFAFLTLWIARTVPATRTPAAKAQGDTGAGTGGSFWLWTALSTCSCLSLMATTSQLTQDVAPVPFLWMIPLAIYLGTFMLCFAGRFRVLSLDIAAALLLLGTLCAIALLDLMNDGHLGITTQIAVFSFTQLCACLYCHTALYETRPEPGGLTRFYLAISLGGVIGGLGTTLVIPHFFTAHWEYPLSFLGTLYLATFILYRRPSFLSRWKWPLLVVVLPLLLMQSFVVMKAASGPGCVEQSRNFYGILRVAREFSRTNNVTAHVLKNGAILHGKQFHTGSWTNEPTTYYGRITGIGLLLANHPKRAAHHPLTVGIVGLGVGTLAAYGQPRDVFRFYEINPEIIRLATRSPWFSYLQHCQATVEIAQGDARLSLESEVNSGQFARLDVLVVDAFSGDSIPIHLLTREAFELYLKRCQDDGVIAVHISNRYLDLLPVLAGIRKHFGLQWKVIDNKRRPPLNNHSTWVLLSPSSSALAAVKTTAPANRILPTDKIPSLMLWTDDSSNLLTILK